MLNAFYNVNFGSLNLLGTVKNEGVKGLFWGFFLMHQYLINSCKKRTKIFLLRY